MFTKMFRGFPVKKTSVTARNCLLAMDDQDIRLQTLVVQKSSTAMESHRETATPSGDVEEDDCRLTVSSLYTLRRVSKLGGADQLVGTVQLNEHFLIPTFVWVCLLGLGQISMPHHI